MCAEKAYITQGFRPQRVLKHFEDICAIPHGSGNEWALSNHIIAMAQAKGYEYVRDEGGNLLVRVPASPGCEKAAPFLLQGHLDMVCAKNEGVALDMENEPVQLVLEGNILRADGTTLGADNAVGLCNMMALMEADDLRHPPLELLFTTREEIGLVGIQEFDISQIRSRRMINMDMGDPDCMVIGSAGSAKFDLEKTCQETPCSEKVLKIAISGLRGGHSGLLAGKNHTSALHLAGDVLGQLCDAQVVRLKKLETPGGGNSIPRAANLWVAVPDVAAAEAQLQDLARHFTKELPEEPGFTMAVTGAESGPCATAEETRAVADFMVLVPYDVTVRNTQHPEWVLCSALLMSAAYDNGRFTGFLAIRGNRDEYYADIKLKIDTVCRMTGVKAKQRAPWVPAWPETTDTPLQKLCRDIFREQCGSEMAVEAEHGTVEVGIIAQRIPDMDIVGFAPKSRGAHTPQEYLCLDTMEPFWNHLTELLSRLCD